MKQGGLEDLPGAVLLDSATQELPGLDVRLRSVQDEEETAPKLDA
jgi:hypothetical protein